jgi:hypothetical protein
LICSMGDDCWPATSYPLAVCTGWRYTRLCPLAPINREATSHHVTKMPAMRRGEWRRTPATKPPMDGGVTTYGAEHQYTDSSQNRGDQTLLALRIDVCRSRVQGMRAAE